MSLTLPLILMLALGGAVCVGLLALGVHLLLAEAQVATPDLTKETEGTKKDETFVLHMITGRIGRVFLPTIESVIDDERKKSIQDRIDAAGRPDNLTVESYLCRKAGEVILYGTMAVVCLFSGQVMLSLIVLAFIALTDLSLYSEKKERQDQIQRQLPDFLDVLAVTVGSGLSFRQALSRVAESMPGVLADEFRVALRQMDLGTSRREAFSALRRRNNNESLGRFVSALQQAEELGAPLADALITISNDIRREDAQYMRRKAQGLNPKVTGITAVTMLPGLLVLIGGGMFLGMDVDFSFMNQSGE